MKKLSLFIKGAAIFILCMTAMSAAQPRKKLGQAGLEFLSVISDAKAGAMANAMTSLEFQSSSLFFNPAGMAKMNGVVEISASNNQWIADITHNAFSLAFRPAGGTYGVLGFTVQTVDYGEIFGTKVSDQPIGYEDTGSIDASAFVIGVGYAKALTDRFSVGGQVKWMRQTLGESNVPGADNTITTVKNEVTPIAFDFGTLFKTGVKSLAFGMSVRNFSKEIKYEQEGFQLPLLFTLGISMDVMDVLGESNLSRSLILSVDATHPRSHPEQLCFALEYKPLEIISLRSGYIANNDEDGPAFGFGISKFGLQLDYAFTPFGVFDNVQRVTARFAH